MTFLWGENMQVARYEQKGQGLVTKSSELFSSQPVETK